MKYVTLIAGLFLIGCTRTNSAVESRVRLSLPEKLTLSNATLEHVVINVSGAGIGSPIVFNWDGCSRCDVRPEPPATFDLLVPQGPGRLVQVLAVYEEDSGGALFFYGDQTADVPAPTLDVSVAKVTTSATLTSGMIAGRYVDARLSAGGPTGQVFITYTPPGKPSMIIEKSSIFAGWFNVFGLREIALDYKLADGSSLSGGPITLDSLTTGTSVIRIERPKALRKMAFGGSQAWTSNQDARIYYAGFFGPDAGAKRACYLSPANYTKISGVFESTGSTLLSYSTSAASSSSVSVSGGAVCAAADLTNQSGKENIDYLAFRPSAMNGLSWGDLPFGFYSIFMSDVANDIDGQIVPFKLVRAPNGTDSYLKFKILPGVNNTVLDGVRVLKRVVPANGQGFNGHDGVPCDEMASGRISGFSEVSSMAMPASPGTQVFSLTLPMTAAEYGQSEFAICPYREGRHLGGVFIRKDNFQNESGGGGASLQITAGSMLFGWGPGVYYQNSCVPLTIYESGSTGPVTQSSSATVALSTSGTIALKANPDCSGATLSSVTIPADQIKATVYMLVTSSVNESISVSGNLDGRLTRTAMFYALYGSPGSRAPMMTANFGGFQSSCTNYDAVLADPFWGGAARPISTPLGYTVAVSTPGTAELRTDCSVTSTILPSTTMTYSYSGGSYNVSDSFGKLALRVLDSTKETEIEFRDGSNRVTYGVLNSPVGLLQSGGRPRIWLRGEPKYLTSSVTNGTLANNSGWMSRVNGIDFTGIASLAVDQDANSYAHVAFQNGDAMAHLSGFDSSTLGHVGSQVSGLLLVKPTASGRLFAAWDGSSHPSLGGGGFSLEYTNTTTLSLAVGNGSTASSATISVPSGSAHLIAFKRVRDAGASSDTLSVSVNGGSWVSATKAYSGAPTPSYVHFGDSGSSFQGALYEAIIYDQTLDNAQIGVVYKYLKDRYPLMNLPSFP